MFYLQIIGAAILFFIFSPNVLFRTPFRANKYAIALLHALLFTVAWTLLNTLYMVEAFDAPSTSPSPSPSPNQATSTKPTTVPRIHKNPISKQCQNNRTDKSCCDEYITVKGGKYPNIHWNDQAKMCECRGQNCPTSWLKQAKADKKSTDKSK